VSGQKDDWILLALKDRPLDRLHLMKALFLTWHRSGRNIPNYFAFEPYLYGPCSFDAYRVLDAMSKEQLITQPSEPLPRWAKFYLTEKGKRAAAEVRYFERSALREQVVSHSFILECAQPAFLMRRQTCHAIQFELALPS